MKNRCKELLDAYEATPVQQNEDAIENYLDVHSRERSTVTAYMMWLVRAAVYGNGNANLLVENCLYYQRKATIPYTFYTGQASQSISIWESDSLWSIGVIDMVRGKTDCRITFCREKGYYDFTYVDSYESADETGFGSEWEYESVYYNEFFCRIQAGEKEDLL